MNVKKIDFYLKKHILMVLICFLCPLLYVYCCRRGEWRCA